jgi:hypothetical protein
MKFPTWQITLRRLGQPTLHYAQTQRPARKPEPGRLILVRDIDGTQVQHGYGRFVTRSQGHLRAASILSKLSKKNCQPADRLLAAECNEGQGLMPPKPSFGLARKTL